MEQIKELSEADKSKVNIQFVCPLCGRTKVISAKVFEKKEQIICGNCSQAAKIRKQIANNKEEHMKRWYDANIKKYGTNNASRDKGVQEKRKRTNLEKFGNEYAIGSLTVRKKIKKSMNDKYGVDSPFESKQILDKAKSTNEERYGGWYMGTQEFRDKSMQTSIEKYGVKYPAQNESIREKNKRTNMEKYGVEESISSSNFKEKTKKTMIEKYGVEHAMQNDKIKREVLRKSGHRRTGGFKGYDYEGKSFDSTYELAYYLWLQHQEKSFLYHPNTPLSYIGSDGKEHLYMPDFLIEGTFYEIKGGCFFNKEGEPYNQYTKEFWWEKYNAMKENNIHILREGDIKEAFDYVKKTYGKSFLKSCRTPSE